MVQGTLQIHTDNLLPIIKKWLYSDRDVFLRELVSNACDAMQKCRVLRDASEISFEDSELKLEITLDSENKTITFADTGIGMSADEVEKYIAQIAFSGAEEFAEKYKNAKDTESIIGHFGLGFYSAYMVAKNVTIDTLSYKPDSKPALWSCAGGSTYNIDEGTQQVRGTRITLELEEDAMEYLDAGKIRTLLQRFCAFLPFPILLNNEPINHHDPLWLKNSTECTEEAYKEFYHFLYPTHPDPVFWIHLNVDYPFNLKGILYFPKVDATFDWQKAHIKLFCNRVFVSENCKDLLPDYLTILEGAIDSPDIPLNVSRSFLQMDRTVRQVGSHIAKKIADKLSSLFHQDRTHFEKIWQDVATFVKLGILQDDKFYEKVKDILLFKTVKNTHVTLSEYLATGVNKVYYSPDESITPAISDLYSAKNLEILILGPHIDSALISFLESKMENVRFQRVDSGLHDLITEDTQDVAAIEAFFQEALSDKMELTVQAKSLDSTTLAGTVILDEDSRRMRDYFAMTQKNTFNFPTKKTFLVNTKSPLIAKILTLKDTDPILAKEITQHLYELSLLSQKELDPKEIGNFTHRSFAILEKLS